jgi:hypothetical protein
MEKYRIIQIQTEMAELAKKAPTAELGEIWQTIPNRREVYKIKKLDILPNAFVFSTSIQFEFDIAFPVYVKINHRNLIFKLNPEDYKTHGIQLVCNFPKEAKAIESRRYQRNAMPEGTEVMLTLRPISEKTAIDVDVRILDVSLMGLGIQVGNINKDFFQRNSVFKIIKVGGVPHNESAHFTVCHITLKDDKNFVKVGMSASAFLSDALMRKIQQEAEKQLLEKS